MRVAPGVVLPFVAVVRVFVVTAVSMVVMTVGAVLVQRLGFLPLVALAGNGGKEQPGGKAMDGFHGRRNTRCPGCRQGQLPASASLRGKPRRRGHE